MSPVPMADFHLRLLHISDLHERGPREPEPWRRRRVLGDAWKRNLDELTEDGTPIDIVCFTGDVAFSGAALEYGPATDFVATLLERLALPIERFFVVPGNHDIQRGAHVQAWQELRKWLPWVASIERSRWLSGGPAPRTCDPEHRDQVLQRSAPYRDWLRDLRRVELLPERSPHGRLGYRAALKVRTLPFSVHVVGLDSAWLCGADDDGGKIMLTEDQVTRLATDQGAALTGFRLALVHHPLSDLVDQASCRDLLARHVDLVLRGHLHHEELATWLNAEQTVRQVASGCLYDGGQSSDWPNACHLLDLTLDEAGRLKRCDVRLRGFSHRGGGFWFDDGSLYREAPAGRLCWWIKPPSLPPPSVRGSTFVGRDAELIALKQALLSDGGPRRPVAICSFHGMVGAGKSFLAEHFAERNASRFPGGVHRISLQPEEVRTADALFGELADRLRIPAAAVDASERVRGRLVEPRALVHIENADTWSAANAAVGLAARLAGCAVIVSGRYRHIGRDTGWLQIDVPAFDEVTAVRQLEAELRAPTSVPDRQRYRELVRALGGLPLAVSMVAGYLRRGESPEGVIALLRKKGLHVMPGDLSNPLLAADRSAAALAASLEVSLDMLRAAMGADPDRFLAGFAALSCAPAAGFGVSLGAAIAGLQPDELERLMEIAFSLSLVQRLPDRPGAWRLHPHLAELLRRRPEAAAGFDRLTEWFIERLPALVAGYELLQAQRWKELEQEAAGLAAWLSQVAGDDLVRVERAGSKYAILSGWPQTWMGFCERGLLVRSDLAERSHLLWTLAQVAIRAGAMARAMEAAVEKESLDWRRGDAREAALAAGCRADILELGGQLDEALRIRRQEEIPVYERLGDERSRAATMGKVADILQTRGELDEALRIRVEEQLPTYERLGHVRSRAVTLGKIATILQARGELDEALRIRRDEQLPIYERLGDERERAATLGKIAALLKARGDIDEALRLRKEEQLPAYERLGDVRGLVVGRANLALAYLARGAPEDRETARELLGLARQAAESLRIPEVHQIRRLQAQHGLLPSR